jgi:diphthine-ammonia ligase
MCSIIGLINVNESKEKIINAFKTLKNRGHDNYGVYFNGKIINHKKIDSFKKEKIEDGIVLAHNLFSIVGNVSQPIEYKKSILVSNCEIYNYKELSLKHKIDSKNDSDFIIKAIEKKGVKIIEEFSGPFAIAYLKQNKLYLRRDLLGIRPLWYSFTKESFAFASEKKVLEENGFKEVNYLNPRKELFYDVLKKKITLKAVPFYKIKTGKTSVKEIHQKIEDAVLKRVPDKTKKIGLLYSGGLDSLVLAKILKDNKIPFTCYFAYSKEIENPKDLITSTKTAKNYDFELKKIAIDKETVQKTLPLLVNLIESSNPVKIGVSLPIYFASKKAREDGCKVVFSGLGSDEIFAGYYRFKESNNLLKDTINLLYQMHENDLYRDDVICMNNNIELRVPYLDKDLIEESFKLKDEQKIKNQENKIILREVGKKIDLLKEDFNRKKVAAQYGSGFDKMIEKIAKKETGKKKAEYLKTISKKENLNLGCLYSGGKDSNLALHIMKSQNYKISCIMTMITENPDSYMFQKVDEKILYLQSQALNIPFVLKKTKGVKEEELKDLKKLILKAKEKYSLQGVITGAIKSNYQRDRIQEICNELDLRLFSPLWNKSQEGVIKEVLDNKFEIMIVKVAGYGLDDKWLGKILTKEDLINLKIINKKKGINVAGEGGEYETIVLNGPTFGKKIKISTANPIMENEFTGYLDILKVEMEDK